MQPYKRYFLSLFFGLCLINQTAQADHHRHGGHYYGGWGRPYSGFSFYFGSPWYPRPYFAYPYPYYYPPAIVTVPAQPPVYIERPAPSTTPSLPAGYWYYCANPPGYYPYVQECPNGWQQVSPNPPN